MYACAVVLVVVSSSALGLKIMELLGVLAGDYVSSHGPQSPSVRAEWKLGCGRISSNNQKLLHEVLS